MICSVHFQGEIHRLGIELSFSFVEEPQTNGVVERFNRTLKEQLIYGEVFKNLDDLRQATTNNGIMQHRVQITGSGTMQYRLKAAA